MVIEGQQQQKTFLGRLANSPINVKNLKEGLKEYGNRIHAKELLDGFTKGFRWGFIGERIPQLSKNLTSVAENPTEVKKKIGYDSKVCVSVHRLCTGLSSVNDLYKNISQAYV